MHGCGAMTNSLSMTSLMSRNQLRKGVCMMNEQQKNFILENYGVAQTNAIALSLGISTATVLRWARRMGLKINPANKQFVPSREQTAFIMKNYGKIPCRIIAEELGISVSAVRTSAKRLGLKISEDKLAKLKTMYMTSCPNPNPVTLTTHMLICRYYYEGSSIANISCTLGRSKEQVKEILNECIENGNYIKYNLYNTPRKKSSKNPKSNIKKSAH